MARITCPYCRQKFPADYYEDWHVPCPENLTDVAFDDPVDDLPPADSAEADELASYAEGAFTRFIFRED